MIEVGEYVRTRKGNIFKIVGGSSDNYNIDIDYYKLETTEDDWYEQNRNNDNGYWFTKEHISKHSLKLTDLLEKNDLVIIEYFSPRYEKRVSRIFEVYYVVGNHIFFDNRHCELTIIDGEWSIKDKILKPVIKSVVTKEQFKGIEYEV